MPIKATTAEKTKEELEDEMKKEHLAFCREYVLNGKNGTQAYMTAYNKTKREENVRISASKFLTNSNVKAYIRHLKEEVKERYNITLETQLEKTAEILKLSKVKEEYRTALACVQEESKLADLYEPEKTESTTKVIWKEEKTYENEENDEK